MATESHSEDGADVFWPGYVDAVTNLVLNLLFLLTIMTVAVFMFALELGMKQSAKALSKDAPPPVAEAPPSPKPEQTEEITQLKKQVADLQKELKLKNDSTKPLKLQSASSAVAAPEKSLEKALPTAGGIVVRFAQDAVALTAAETAPLRKTLEPVVASGGARITVMVPPGFSEARRLGFYRAMAVRNLLIELKVPGDRIDVTVREGNASSDATQVRVDSR